MLNYSQLTTHLSATLALTIATTMSLAHAADNWESKLAKTPADDIEKHADLKKPTLELGKKVYQAHCVSCHGTDLKGVAGKHVPDLSDKVTIYASDNVDAAANQLFVSDFETTVRVGIRADHPDTRKLTFMPSYAGLKPKQEGGYATLPAAQIADLVEFLLSNSGQKADKAAAARGQKLFDLNAGCFDCHAQGAEGDGAFGTPDLRQPKYFLYGSDRAAITASIREGRSGTMPAYAKMLKPAEIKAIAYYLYTVRNNAKS